MAWARCTTPYRAANVTKIQHPGARARSRSCASDIWGRIAGFVIRRFRSHAGPRSSAAARW